jgi:hypothetical protein
MNYHLYFYHGLRLVFARVRFLKAALRHAKSPSPRCIILERRRSEVRRRARSKRLPVWSERARMVISSEAKGIFDGNRRILLD